MVHHEIVALERWHQPLPANFPLAPHTYNLTEYHTHAQDAAELAARCRPATILIVTTIKIDAAILARETTPDLQLIAVMATGVDHVDLEAARRRGIRVTNCPAANLDAVSEHAVGLYFAARRRTVMMHGLTRQVPSEWKEKKSLLRHMKFVDGKPPLTCSEEVMGIVGYGGLGKRIAHLGRALGMEVIVAARKNPPSPPALGGADTLPGPTVTPDASPSAERVPFDEVLRRSTVLCLSLPRTPESENMLSSGEFAQMSPYAVVVNVARGGIVDETAALEAVKEKRIAGYATDVFEVEPAEGPADSPLLSEEACDLNITVSPHLAWFSQKTLQNLGQIQKNTIEAWVANRPINVIV